jgi:hyperosmotically inducible protein
MRKGSLKKTLGVAAVMLAVALGLTPLVAAPRDTTQSPASVPVPLVKEVRHSLLMLPFYGVFDNLTFEVQGDNVTLKGEVTRPILKSDAQNVVSRIRGIGKVTNDIEVLPLSPYDNHLRLALYRRIYSTPGLDLYAVRAVPTIHIIVKNGNVTLVGAVGNQMDKNLAGIVANGVPGIFSVTNDLTVG